jgi:hypothetical protein
MVSSRKLENAIAADLTIKGVPIAQVRCPRGVRLAKGGDFICTVTLEDGQQLPIEVAQRDDRGDVEWHAGALVPVRILEERLERDSPGAKFSCVGRFMVPRKGATFACTSTTGTRTTAWRVTFTDDAGGVEVVPLRR